MNPETSRQLILEQAILKEISSIKAILQSLRWAYEPYWDDDDEDRPLPTREDIAADIKLAEEKIVDHLGLFLKSVCLSYKGPTGLEIEKNVTTGWRVQKKSNNVLPKNNKPEPS
jgi:hypothetical protein